MSDWSAAGWPVASVDGYAYAVGAGLVRSPTLTNAPRQVRAYTQRPRTLQVRYLIPAASLPTLDAWVAANGYGWHTQPLASADTGGLGTTDHRVRFTGALSVTLADAGWVEVSATLEQEAADETCALVANAAAYTACLGADMPDTLGLDWPAIAAAWGTIGDPW